MLPSELSDFRTQFDHHGNSLGNKIFIIKPDAGCQGRGIFLTRTYDIVPTNENVVAQVYIKKPLLIDGFKFDLRIYCLVTSVKPLRVYLFNDGLVRLCTEQYVKPTKQNLDNACMHLTNYAVNKNNAAFTQPGEEESAREDSSKRALQWFMDGIISKHGADKANQLWRRIGTLCVRTILSIMPTLAREYDQHFKAFEGIPQVHSPGLNGMNTAGVEENNDEGRDMGGDGSEEVPAEDEKRDGINGSAPLPSVRGCRCFEILGLDIMIDTALRPTLIEVNHLPRSDSHLPQ